MDVEDVLIYDLECAAFNDDPDPEKDVMKFFGCYSYKTGKYAVIPASDKKFIQKVIDSHKFLVGFNNKHYDEPILKRFGFNTNYKRIVDLKKIIEDRASSMKTNKGMLGDKLMYYSLDYITRFLNLVNDDEAKDEIDYKIFQKNQWTDEEKKKIIFYTKRDIEITKKLYEWIEKYFEGFKDFVPSTVSEGKYHLTDTPAKFGYKADCHAMKWEPVFNTNAFNDSEETSIDGGYVAYPAGDKFEAKQIKNSDGTVSYENIIVQLDFSSLYPAIMMMANLHSRNKNGQGWHGGNLFEVEGYYDDTEMSGLGKLLRKWYYQRLYYKRKGVLSDGTIFKYKNADKHIGEKYYHIPEQDGFFELEKIEITNLKAEQMKKLSENYDDKEYTIKILINLQYGILNHPYYQLVYDSVAGGDCTRLGRQFVKYARKVFREHGYPIVYSDTDSWYFIDVFNDKQKYLKLKNKVINDIKSSMPFPQVTFDADIDDEIKYMFFFKGDKNNDKDSDSEMDSDDVINKPKGLMKKNYIYVTLDDNIIVKNLGLAKKNLSAVTKKIFWDYMADKLKSNGQVKFTRTEIENKMVEYLQKDISLALMRKKVKSPAAYKKSKTGLPYQISVRYGPGIHFLIPNNKGFGVGKKSKYCSFEEFKEKKMSITDVDFSKFWKELAYFIKKPETKNLMDWD